jgi:Tol biopolymer transport system component
MVTQRTAPVWACGALMALTIGSADFVTVSQSDPFRSPRAARTSDVSADGRFVAFESWARLVPADDNQRPDIYVLDRETGRITLETETDNAGGDASRPRISGDGRYIVFEVRSAGAARIVLRDRSTSTDRIVTASGADGTGWSRDPDISDDARVVAFSSTSTTLTSEPDANGPREDVYTFQVATGVIARVSLSVRGTQPSAGTSIVPTLSGDGRWIAFASTAPLEATDPRSAAADTPVRHVYVRDTYSGTLARASRTLRDAAVDGHSSVPSASADGRFVTFASDASNIAEGDGNRGSDVFLFDRARGETTLVSRAVGGAAANGTSANPAISGDGRFVAFQSDAGNMVCAARCPAAHTDINLLWDTFVFDRSTGAIARVSEDELGGWMDWSAGISIDGTGRVVAFSSRHPRNASDRADDLDLFVRVLRPVSATQVP